MKKNETHVAAALAAHRSAMTGVPPGPDVYRRWDTLLDYTFAAVSEVEAIFASTNYTPEGKAVESAKVRQKFHDQIGGQRHLVRKYRERMAEIEKSVQAPTEKSSDIAAILAELAEREVRDGLRDKDPLKVQMMYLDAIETGDEVTVRALEHAPKILSRLTPDARALGLSAKLQKSPHLADYETLRQDLAMELDLLQSAVHDVEKAINPHYEYGVPQGVRTDIAAAK